MIKKLIWIFLLSPCLGQTFVTITGTVQSPSGQPYTNGTGVVNLVPNPFSCFINGTNPVNSPIPIAALDSAGKFTVQLANTSFITCAGGGNAQWVFSFSSNPLFTAGVAISFTMTPMSLTFSQDISSQIQAQSINLPGGGTATAAPPLGSLQGNSGGAFGGIPFTTANFSTGAISVNPAGVFNDTTINQWVVSNINSLNFLTEYQAMQGLHGMTAGVGGGIVVTNSGAGIINAGVAGFANTNVVGGAGHPNALGIYGQARALANGSDAFGANFAVKDVAGLTSGVLLNGMEIDLDPQNGPSAYAGMVGSTVILGPLASNDYANFRAYDVATGNGGGTIGVGYGTENGSADSAFSAGAGCSGVSTCNSQPYIAVGLNGGSNATSSWKADSSGDFVITPKSGSGILAGGQLFFPSGLGAINHIQGPTDQILGIASGGTQNISLTPGGTTTSSTGTVTTSSLNHDIHMDDLPAGTTLQTALALCPATGTCRVYVDATMNVNAAANGSYPAIIGSGYQPSGGAPAQFTNVSVVNLGTITCTQTGLAANTTVDCLQVGNWGHLTGDNAGNSNAGGGLITCVSSCTYRYIVTNSGVCVNGTCTPGTSGAPGYQNYLQQKMLYDGNAIQLPGTATVQAELAVTAVEGVADIHNFGFLGKQFTINMLFQDAANTSNDNNNILVYNGTDYCGNQPNCVPLDIEGTQSGGTGNGIDFTFHNVVIGNGPGGWGCNSGAGCMLNIDGSNHGLNTTHFVENIQFDGLYLEMSGTYPAWQANTVYALGNAILPTSNNGSNFYFQVTTAGTSGGSQPVWTTTPAVCSAYSIGGTCTDGTVTWTIRGAGNANNPSHYVEVTNARDVDVRGFNINAGAVGNCVTLNHLATGTLGRVELRGYVIGGHCATNVIQNLVSGTNIPGGNPLNINYLYPGDHPYSSLFVDGPLQTGNTVTQPADGTPITTTGSGQAIFSFPNIPALSNMPFHCSILYTQQTAVAAGTGFGIQSQTTAPIRLDAWGQMDITAPTSGNYTGSFANVANITDNAVHTIVTGTPGLINTVYNARIDGLLQTGSTPGTLRVTAFTGNGADSITIKAGSFCSLVP